MGRIEVNELVAILLILALAAAVRFLNLGNASLWLDEVETVRIANLPWNVLWITPYDPTPPLFYTIERWILSFGQSEFLLRLPSAIFGTLTVGVVYAMGRSLAGPRAAVPAALLLALSWYNVEYSQEARAYALVSLGISLSALGLIHLWRAANGATHLSFFGFLRCGGLLYAVSLLAALYSHNTAVFFWLAANAYFVFHWSTTGRKSPRLAAFWIVVNAMILIAWLPWFAAAMQNTQFGWLPQATAVGAAGTFVKVHGFVLNWYAELPLDLMLGAFGLLGLVRMYGSSSNWALLLFALLASSLGLWLYGFVSTPVYMARTILWGTVFSSVLVGIGIAVLSKPLYWLSVAAIAFVSALSIVEYFQSNAAENQSFRSAANMLQHNAQDTDALVFCQSYVAPSFAYYIEKPVPSWNVFARRRGTAWTTTLNSYDNGTLKWKQSSVDLATALAKEISASVSRHVWFVVSHCFGGSDVPVRAALKSAGWQHDETFEFRGITLERYLSR